MGVFLLKLIIFVMDPGYNSYNRDFIEDNADLLNVPIEIFENVF